MNLRRAVRAVLLLALGASLPTVLLLQERADDTAADVCTEVRSLHDLRWQRLREGASGTLAQNEIRQRIADVAVVIEQNPTCFTPTERADMDSFKRRYGPRD